MPHGHIHSCLKSSTNSRTRDTGPQAPPPLTSTALRPSGRTLLRFHIPSSCRPRVAIIGSREQLCIHPEVSKKESNSEKVDGGTPTGKKQSTFLYTQASPRTCSTSSQVGTWPCTNLTPQLALDHKQSWLPVDDSTIPSSIQVHLCRAKVQSHSCGYYANVNGTAQSCYSISAQVIY